MNSKICFLPLVFILLSFSCNKTDEDKSMTIINGTIIDSIGNTTLQGVVVQLYKHEMFAEFPLPVSGYNTISDSFGKFKIEFKSEEGYKSYYLELKKLGYQYCTPYCGALVPVDLGQTNTKTYKMVKSN